MSLINKIPKQVENKTVAIMQPTYFPWAGYFDLIDQSDVFVFLDDVKLERSSWQVRNRIKTTQGEQYISVPVKRIKSRPDEKINESYIDYKSNFVQKHLKTLYLAYKKCEYFDEVYSFIESILNNKFEILSEFNIRIIKELCSFIKLEKKFIKSSELNIDGNKDYRLYLICKELKCNIYVSPQGSFSYLESSTPGGEIVKNDIELFYQNYIHPAYNQLHGEFIPYMSIIDLLFNCGPENCLSIVRSGHEQPFNYKQFRELIFNKANEKEN